MKKNLLGAALMMALATGKVFENIPFFKRHHSGGGGARAINRSKYRAPHQGDREKARRLRQIEAGIIQG